MGLRVREATHSTRQSPLGPQLNSQTTGRASYADNPALLVSATVYVHGGHPDASHTQHAGRTVMPISPSKNSLSHRTILLSRHFKLPPVNNT
jgi:hypothetical protein